MELAMRVLEALILMGRIWLAALMAKRMNLILIFLKPLKQDQKEGVEPHTQEEGEDIFFYPHLPLRSIESNGGDGGNLNYNDFGYPGGGGSGGAILIDAHFIQIKAISVKGGNGGYAARRSEERRVGKECRSRWS